MLRHSFTQYGAFCPIVPVPSPKVQGHIVCSVKASCSSSKPSRRNFIRVALSLALPIGVEAIVASPLETKAETEIPPRRTVFDEERMRNEEMLQVVKEKRNASLRAAFDAVEKAKSQLEDIDNFVKDSDWPGIRNFIRLFNDAVVREGMEKTAKRLDDRNLRAQALTLSKSVTDELRAIDRDSKQSDGVAIAIHVDRARNMISDFQKFRP